LVPDLFAPADLGPIRLRNRVIKAATFEGMTPRGEVTDRLIEYHRRPAAGGVGMTTLAYCSVAPDGRTYRDQIVVGAAAAAGLRRFTDAIHAEGAAAAIQLGHAGYFADPRAIGQRSLGPSRRFNPYGLAYCRELTDADLGRLLGDYANATRLAIDAGFDGIEVHVGHGYLLSQFLSPWTNRRRDRWGGDIQGRARFPRAVLQAVRDAAGGRAAVWAKLNMVDGFRGGLTIEEGVEVARMLDSDGSVDALELTAGFTSRTPMFLLRGDVPLREMIDAEPDRFRRVGLRLVSRRLLREYPFEDAFLRPYARQVRDAVAVPIILLGGLTRLDTLQSAMDEGFGFVAMARALLRDPDLVLRFAGGIADRSRCVPCNKCIAEMDRGGTRCVFVPDELVEVP
jgi:2,4-dienoyl-CoA reductase-like NADH-dependent reductase (Old Yellow Enzyme family)